MATHLQGRHTLARGLWVFPQQPFLIQELAVPPIAGRLEEPIVEYILQALVQGTQDSLLGHPHGGIWVKPNALLWGEQRHGSGMPKVIRATNLGTGSKESLSFCSCPLCPKEKFTFASRTERLRKQGKSTRLGVNGVPAI